ncbi:MAG: YhfC family intramembrane metalloprotease [Anaerolineales bacterium]|nr:YhfC family intramembrane metalloprotease [Anaerolineales bacterium]
MKRILYLSLVCIGLSLLTGCATQHSNIPMNYRWATVQGSQLNFAQAGEEFYFSIFVDEGMIAERTPIKIKLSGDVQSGTLRFELRDPDGGVVWNSGTIQQGDFSINAEYDLPSARTGTYTLGLVYSENISATYDLGWHAIKLGAGILVPGAGMILVALAFVLYAARRKWLGWRYLGLGALFWVLTVVVKFAFAIPVNPPVFRALGVGSEQLFSPGNLTAYLYIGALTGIFEAGLAYLILRNNRWGKAAWDHALVFGIGFGVVEALLLGLAGLLSGLVGITAPDALPIPTLGSMAANSTLVMGLAPVVERLFVILAHIFSCVLIFYAIASGEAKWAWLAVLYKTVLDAPAGFASFWGVTNSAAKLWTIEAVIALIGLIGLWGTLLIIRRYQRTQTSSEPP